MKKFLLLSAFVFSVSFSIAQKPGYDTIPFILKYHQKKLKSFYAEPIVTGRIIFAGNSLTEGGNWKKLLNDSTILNRGIAGDISFGLLHRVDEITMRKPSLLLLEIGINDISKNIPIEVIVGNIIHVATKVHAESPETKVYVASLLPINDSAKLDYPNLSGKSPQIKILNKKLKAVSIKNQISFIDLYKEFSDIDGKLLHQYSKDGLHINEMGYRRWVAILKNAMILN